MPTISRVRSLRAESLVDANSVDDEPMKALQASILRYDEVRKTWREELVRHLASAKKDGPEQKKPMNIIQNLLGAVGSSNPGVSVERVGDHVVVNVQQQEGEVSAQVVARALR